MARTFLERLSTPKTPLEKLVERGLLLEVAVQFGHTAHKTFHQQYAAEEGTAATCGFQASSAVEDWPKDLTQSPAEAFRRWAGRYAAGFRATHPLACAREAQHHVHRHFREAISAGDLARHLDCPVTFLRRTFQQLTGKSLLQYQSELRLATALQLLTETHWKVESIAREVGYRSKKDLYRVVQSHVACTPLEYRMQRRSSGASGRSGRGGKVS